MDYYLTRKSSMEILEYKQGNANVKSIPVIVTAGAVDKEKLLDIVKRGGVKKVLNKPIKIDTLLNAIAEIFGESIEIDNTPCLLDAHLNDKILFVEIARGFNIQKINLLKYKIAELIKLYEVRYPKILILLTDVELYPEDEKKFEGLLETVFSFLQKSDDARILTTSGEIKKYLHKSKFKIPFAENLTNAMDGLFGTKGLESLTAEQDNVQNTFFTSKKELRDNEAFQLNFESEGAVGLAGIDKDIRIAVVDDDIAVLGIVETAFKNTHFKIDKFTGGQEFIAAVEKQDYDLLFLDLMMPGMNGFAVLQFLSTNEKAFPVIVMSALTRKESVEKALDFGIRSYMIKPVKPQGIVKKTIEVLKTNF